jgi:hypothetical protein
MAYKCNPLKTETHLSYTQNSVPTSQRTQSVSIRRINPSMLLTEKNAVYDERSKHKTHSAVETQRVLRLQQEVHTQ